MMSTSHPLRLGNRSGFTLLELLVSIALIGLLMGLVVAGSNRLFDRDMKKTADRLAATIRYLHDKAATEGTYIRLVLDLDEQSYVVEATRDPYLIATASEVAKPKIEKSTPQKKEEPGSPSKASAAKKKKRGAAAQEEGVEKLRPKEPTFTPLTERLLKPTRLPDTVFFKDVHVERQSSVFQSGKALITFFPNGTVQEAIINLRDEDDEVHYSLKVNPMNGRVNIESGYRTLEER